MRACGRIGSSLERVVHRTCTLCEACCGIEVHVEGERIARIRGDALDPLSRGHVCAKVYGLRDLYEDPDRLRQPVRRTASGWQPIDWAEAYAYAAEGIVAVQRRHGLDSAAFYFGEPTVHNLGAMLFMDELARQLGSRKRFSANTLDQMPKQLVSHWMYGSGFFISVPDVDRTAYLLIIGANPVVSNGSLMTAPGMRRRLRETQERGGRVVVIDPRRSETAARADEHQFIRPGSDALLLSALLHTVLREKRVDTRTLPVDPAQLEQIAEFVSDFAPERVEDRVGIPAATIRRIAAEFCDAESAVCYGRMGTCTHAFGTTTSWLIEVLNVITGNLDRAGGAMFPNPAVDVAALQPRTQRGRWHSRARGIPEFMGELPTATLAEEINTPGAEQIRAVVTLAGNPALSSPAGHRLAEALADLEFMVSIDFYLNETTRHADVILPPVSPLEREHYDVGFQVFAVRNVPHWSPRVFEPPERAPADGEILLELARRLCAARSRGGKLLSLLYRAALGIGAERVARAVLDLALRSGPQGSRFLPWRRGVTLRKLRQAIHGIDFGPMRPGLPERLPADAIDLAPRELLEDRTRLLADLQSARPSFTLVGRRETRTINSWSHNLPSFVKGPERCFLEIHPDDAAALGLSDGAQVRVSSRVGSIQVPARSSDAMMPGVVSLPHGYGHGGEGIRLGVAAQHAGASLNDLTDAAEIDPFSGNAVLNGTPVRIALAP